MRQRPPVFGPEVSDRDAIANAAGLEPRSGRRAPGAFPRSTGLAHLMVPVQRRSGPAPRRTRRPRMRRGVRGRGRGVPLPVRGPRRRRRDGADVRPGTTIGEDPATGSAAGPLGRLPVGTRTRGHAGEGTVAQGEMVRRPELPPRRGRSRCGLLGDLGCRRRADRGRRRVRGLSVRPRDRM